MFVFPSAVALYENMWFGQLGPGKAVYQRSKTANSEASAVEMGKAPSEKPCITASATLVFPFLHRALKFHEAVHQRHAVLDVELHLVGRVAVPRLLDGDVRRAVEDRDRTLARVPTVDGIRLVSFQPVDLERLLVAQEVVEGAVLLVEHHDVLDAVRTRRQR